MFRLRAKLAPRINALLAVLMEIRCNEEYGYRLVPSGERGVTQFIFRDTFARSLSLFAREYIVAGEKSGARVHLRINN